MEGDALVIQRQCVPRDLDLVAELVVLERDRPDRNADCSAQFLERNAISFDRVEQSDELDLGLVATLRFDFRRQIGMAVVAPNEAPNVEQRVAYPAGQPYGRQGPLRRGLVAVGAPGHHGVALHLPARNIFFFALRVDEAGREQTLMLDQPGQRADGESTAAESEHVDFIAGFPIPADEPVELADVGRHAEAGDAVQQREWLEAGGSDAFYVVRNLIGLGLIERLVKPPDVGLLDRKSVSRSVGKDDNFFLHIPSAWQRFALSTSFKKSMAEISATVASLA